MSSAADVVIVGAGGFGLEVLLYWREVHGSLSRIRGFVDDEVPVGEAVDDDLVVIGTTEDPSLLSGGVLIAIGDADARHAVAAKVEVSGGQLLTLVHPTAYVAPSAQVGRGTILCPFAMVGAHAVVGDNVIINVYSSVGHEAVVGDHVVLSPYSALLGRTKIGSRCHVATHTTVAPGVNLGQQSKASAGAVVMRDAPAGSMLIGNPAKGRVMFRVDEA